MRPCRRGLRLTGYVVAAAAVFAAVAGVNAVTPRIAPGPRTGRANLVVVAGRPSPVTRPSPEQPVAPAAPGPRALQEAPGIDGVLDAFHAAAAAADEEKYFALLADNAVFLGTDATERWTKAAFREYAHPHFAAGKGWAFRPRDRKVDLSRAGEVAWFDELLDSDHLGVCRGSGVLEKHGGAWLITQYNLSIPVPNDLARDFVARIREFEKSAPGR